MHPNERGETLLLEGETDELETAGLAALTDEVCVVRAQVGGQPSDLFVSGPQDLLLLIHLSVQRLAREVRSSRVKRRGGVRPSRRRKGEPNGRGSVQARDDRRSAGRAFDAQQRGAELWSRARRFTSRQKTMRVVAVRGVDADEPPGVVVQEEPLGTPRGRGVGMPQAAYVFRGSLS